MVTTAKHIADRIGADERTLRRAVEQGTLRVSRTSARRLTLSEAEDRYLRSHWGLLQRLRAVLRTEPNVRLAAVFGSLARGDGDADADLDLLVDLHDESWRRTQRLRTRLERALDRPVDLVVAGRVDRDNPALLAEALADGRVIVDRDARWPSLKRRAPALRRAAHAQASETRALVDELDQE
jgi:predicted nucleotidyltransferase